MFNSTHKERLKYLSGLPRIDFYSKEVLAELTEMKEKKVFSVLNWQSRKLLKHNLWKLSFIQEPVFQIVKALKEGVIECYVSEESQVGENKKRKYWLYPSEREQITFEKETIEGYPSISASSRWLTHTEKRLLIAAMEDLQFEKDLAKHEQDLAEDKEERLRISNLLLEATNKAEAEDQ